MKHLFCAVLLTMSALAAAQTSPIDSVVQRYAASKQFHGAVVVARDGRTVYKNAVGVANRETNERITSGTVFKIASLTKTFTTVLVMQLVEEGRLDLKATIGKYLPDYQGNGRDKVTLHHLLTYSSGIPNCEGDGGMKVYQSAFQLDDFIRKHCSGDLFFEPGAQFDYNNADYILLGKIIEKVTGKSFGENLKARILEPLAMGKTGMASNDMDEPTLVQTYHVDSVGVLQADIPYFIESYYAAGAMFSTVDDLLKFSNGLFSGKLVKKSTLDLMLTPYPELYGVAYGFWVFDSPLGKAANRQGSIWGANADWLHLIDKKQTVIVLSNTNATDLPAMREEILNALNQ